MQSIIIVGLKEKAKEKVLEIAKENNISRFDIETVETEKALGIPDVRILQKKVFLTPLKGDKKIVIIEAFLGATTEAQNALLKVFEEPPQSTIMVILCKSIDFILPTILSRCTLITLDEKKEQTNEQVKNSLNILKQIKKDPVGKGFLYAQNYGKTREDALDFLENLTIAVHSIMGKKNEDFSQKEIGKILTQVQKFYTFIKTTNVNVRFALENLFLNLRQKGMKN